jgi:hypothetical protein
MKAYLYFMISGLIVLNACTSPRGHYKRGNYDAAIKTAIPKIKKNPSAEKHIIILQKSFIAAQSASLEKVNFLKMEGQPSSWDKITSIYAAIQTRQQRVKSLPPLNIKGRMIEFDFVNIDEELIQSKQKAANYSYTKGTNLLEKGDTRSARLAFDEFMKVKQIYPDFRDIDKMIEKASQLGTSRVLVSMKNHSGAILPKTFESDLLQLSVNELNRKWVLYHTNAVDGIRYDYNINVILRMIDVAPESVKEVHYTESKDIQDGFKYEYDAKGNVKKDSLGNDIKTPKFKTITCNVIETIQRKSARVSGQLEYINNGTGQLMKSEPVTADALFEHFSVMTVGDIKALKPETKAKTGKTPVPFPNDFDMLMRANGTLKNMVKDIIYKNKEFFK